MSNPLIIAIGRLTKAVARLRGGGSALPGYIVERLDPHFMAEALGRLPEGVIVVSGTNGKTTTTKMLADLLRGQGLKVFTNPTGSNFTRGVVTALLDEVDWSGWLDADIAVLELDEAHAVHFVEQVRPRVSVLLNVLRDQLDRFGEIDTTAGMLLKVAQATTGTVVLNRDDPRVRAIADHLSGDVQVRYFGYAPALADLFPDDDRLHETRDPHEGSALAVPPAPADVELAGLDGERAVYRMDRLRLSVDLQLAGVHNALNAAAALAGARAALPEEKAHDDGLLMATLGQVKAAFGRGETFDVDGRPVRLSLVKNPAGFRSSLRSLGGPEEAVMIAINDQYADGRDMSWLWDVDFSALRARGVTMVSGVRAWDMALRLHYDLVDVARVEPALGPALDAFLEVSAGRPARIFCTYTAMLQLRREMSRHTEVEPIGA